MKTDNQQVMEPGDVKTNAKCGELGILSREGMEGVHQESLGILERVGVRVGHPPMQKLLGEAGAKVDLGTGVVKLPEKLVLEAIDSTPKEFALYNRTGGVLSIRTGQFILGTAERFSKVLDLDSHEIRKTSKKDAADLARLADYIPSVSVNCAFAVARDLPEDLVELNTLEAVFLNTTKHCFFSPSALAGAKLWIQLAEILCQGGDLAGNPIISACVAATAPLQFAKNTGQMLLYLASKGIPVGVQSAPIIDSRCSSNIADLLARQNAEFLFALTTIEQVRKGTPAFYGAPACPASRRGSGVMSKGWLWDAVAIAAAAAMAGFYGIPSYAKPVQTDSMGTDIQAGMEITLLQLAALLSKLTVLLGAGQLGSGTIASYEQLVIDGELLAVCKRFAKPIRVDAETMGVETIAKVGPGGHFLIEDHTLRWMRDEGEFYRSPIFHRDEGAPNGNSTLEKAREMVREILVRHRPQIPDAQAIGDFVRSKEAEIVARRS